MALSVRVRYHLNDVGSNERSELNKELAVSSKSLHDFQAECGKLIGLPETSFELRDENGKPVTEQTMEVLMAEVENRNEPPEICVWRHDMRHQCFVDGR